MSRKKASKLTSNAGKPQNIAEFAEMAGVSAATVSRALSGSGNLAAATRERIRKLAKELQFEPSNTARNLRTGRSGAIGLVVPLGHERTQHISDPFFMALLGLIADRLVERGYDLLLSRVVPTDSGWLQRIVDAGRVDGIIMIGQSNQAQVINDVAATYRPLVVWGAHLEGHRYCTIGTDNRQGALLATKHLLSQGCRKLAFFGDPEAPEVAQRLQGFRDALQDQPDAIGALLPVHFVPDMASEAITGYLALSDGVDGIVAASDTIAMITIRALAEGGREVPDRVKVVGFDDLELTRHTVPPISSIRQNLESGADALVESLFALMAGERPASVLLKPELIERASSARSK